MTFAPWKLPLRSRKVEGQKWVAHGPSPSQVTVLGVENNNYEDQGQRNAGIREIENRRFADPQLRNLKADQPCASRTTAVPIASRPRLLLATSLCLSSISSALCTESSQRLPAFLQYETRRRTCPPIWTQINVNFESAIFDRSLIEELRIRHRRKTAHSIRSAYFSSAVACRRALPASVAASTTVRGRGRLQMPRRMQSHVRSTSPSA